MYDIIIIGGGPAGLSAAITARTRGLTAAVITTDRAQSGLYKAPSIANYPGLPAISGSELLSKLTAHAAGMGAELLSGRVISVMAGDTFFVSYGQEFAEGRALILSAGIVQTGAYEGEKELLGRGVSYCATCDGMLYRGKRVCAVCLAPDSEAEAEHLESIGCIVTRVKKGDIRINGSERVESVTVDGEDIPCEGVFILRRSIAPDTLIPGLELRDGHIAVDKDMATNIPGVFAAGDCIGRPYQIAKAVGEGQLAAFSAEEHIKARS